jgi:hypothetical protein
MHHRQETAHHIIGSSEVFVVSVGWRLKDPYHLKRHHIMKALVMWMASVSGLGHPAAVGTLSSRKYPGILTSGIAEIPETQKEIFLSNLRVR